MAWRHDPPNETPDPDARAEVPHSGPRYASGDMSWLVQLIGEMKQDLGNIQAKIDRLSDDQARTQEKIDSLVKFSWYARGMATVAALVIAFMLWLFAERVEELRRYIILAPAANVESMIR